MLHEFSSSELNETEAENGFFLKNVFKKPKNKTNFYCFLRNTVDCCAQHIRTKIKGTNFNMLTQHCLFFRKKMDELVSSELTVISEPKLRQRVRYMRAEMRGAELRLCPFKLN